jgi:hypothetical protein
MNRYKAEFRFKAAPMLGLTDDEATTILRKAQTLHTWAEHECNGTKQREEKQDATGAWIETGRVFWYNPNTGDRCGLTPDLERGAIKAVSRICEAHGLNYEHQGDPRGFVLKLIKDGREFGVPTN